MPRKNILQCRTGWPSIRDSTCTHFTPIAASWMNTVERFFRDLTTERLRRSVFTQREQRRALPELHF
jgi:hypothetical protein